MEFLVGTSRGGHEAEFGLRGGGLRMFFADGESKNFLCRRSGGGDIFASNMPMCYYRIRNFAKSRRSRSWIVLWFAEEERTRSKIFRSRSGGGVKKMRLRPSLGTSCVGGGVRGVQEHPQKFWFVENPNKIPENLGKNGAQCCLTSKNATQGLQKNRWRPYFWRSHHKNGWQKLHNNFLGTFGKNWAKILCTPKNLLAPTPMVGTISLSCELYSLSWSGFRSCEVGTIVYGKGVLFYMCSTVEVACLAQNIRHSSNAYVLASTVVFRCL